MKSLYLLKPLRNLNAGEIAGFDDEEAARLIETGGACEPANAPTSDEASAGGKSAEDKPRKK